MPTALRPLRFLLLALAGLSLLAAMWAGLARMGWNLSIPSALWPADHGPLMIVGFLGTLIGLERAVALGWLWAYGAPLLSAASGALLLAGFPLPARLCALLASLFLASALAVLCRTHPSLALFTVGAGSLLWLAGNLLWFLDASLHRVAPWWAGFLALTIAGERMELSRLLRLSLWDRLKFLSACALAGGGLLVTLFDLERGVWFAGLGWLAMALWLLQTDIAWRTIRHPGLPRYMAICLLSGYAWLGLAGLLWLASPGEFTGGARYDAMLHAIFLGLAFSMIFAHAPVIFPTITGKSLPFRRAFYGHLLLLQLSLCLRIGGDLLGSLPPQQWGGAINALAILLFLANNARAAATARSRT